MQSPILFIFLLSSYATFFAFGADVLDKVAAETKQILESSKEGAHLIRECSCPEEQMCMKQMQTQLRDCFHSCWAREQQITQLSANSEQLKQCFTSREHLLNEFVQCVKNSDETCVNTKAGPQIPYFNLNRLIGAGEQRIKAQTQAFLRSIGGQNRKLVQAAVDIGTCVKTCFIQGNGRGSCFDKSECNPKVEEDLAGPIIKRCARQIAWKKEASEMCDCALNAGVPSLKPYCEILRGAVKSRTNSGDKTATVKVS